MNYSEVPTTLFAIFPRKSCKPLTLKLALWHCLLSAVPNNLINNMKKTVLWNLAVSHHKQLETGYFIFPWQTSQEFSTKQHREQRRLLPLNLSQMNRLCGSYPHPTANHLVAGIFLHRKDFLLINQHKLSNYYAYLDLGLSTTHKSQECVYLLSAAAPFGRGAPGKFIPFQPRDRAQV